MRRREARRGGPARRRRASRAVHSAACPTTTVRTRRPPRPRRADSCSSTNTWRCCRSGTVAKILPRTRNEPMSWCGSSVASGNDSAICLATAYVTIRGSASGLTGEPVPRGITSGATTNWNSQRPASAHAAASASKSALSRIGMPMYGSRIVVHVQGDREALRVRDALIRGRRVLHVPHEHRRVGARGGTRCTTRARPPASRSPGRVARGREVRPVAAADRAPRRPARGSMPCGGGGVGELPAVHRRARLDVLGAPEPRDVVQHAARHDAVAPEVDRAGVLRRACRTRRAACRSTCASPSASTAGGRARRGGSR